MTYISRGMSIKSRGQSLEEEKRCFEEGKAAEMSGEQWSAGDVGTPGRQTPERNEE